MSKKLKKYRCFTYLDNKVVEAKNEIEAREKLGCRFCTGIFHQKCEYLEEAPR